MYKITRAFMTFTILLILFSTLAGSALAAKPPRAKWTVMVYISGDNNLEEYVVKDIELELAPTGSSVDVQVVALADRGPGYDTSYGDWQTTKLFHVTQGMTAAPENAVADWGERNMGDSQTLIDFVKWTKKNYPADHYVLYFWGHGWSWHPGYVMADDTDEDALDFPEVQAVLPRIGFIDVVGYDACNMASIEVHHLWHGNATALVGSQDFINWDGIEYDVVLSQLSDNPDMTPDQVAIATSQSVTNDRSMSAVAVDERFDALLTAVDEWSIALKEPLDDYQHDYRVKYHQAFMLTQNFWNAPMDKDLYDMAYQIDRLVDNSNIQAKSQAVMSAVEAVVLDENHTMPIKDSHGITIYHISKASDKDEDYDYYHSDVPFAEETGWGQFLDIYLEGDAK